MDDKIERNHQRYLERAALFKAHGYDIECEREIVFEQAQPVKGSLLDVGTGKGHFAIILARNGFELISVDCSPEEQEFAKMNAQYAGVRQRIDFQIADAQQLTFDDNSFDTVFMVNALHHLEKPFEAMSELIRVLRPGGKIIISDFTKKGMALVDDVHRKEGREHAQAKASVNDVADYLEQYSFDVEKHRTVFQETIVARHGRGGAA